MSVTLGGEQAFPTQQHGCEGMTMLEYYATAAMKAILTAYLEDKSLGFKNGDVACNAFNIAEAMVAEAARRAKK